MGKITLLQKQKRNRQRMNLHIDGEYYCSLDAEVALRHGLFEGQELDCADFAMLIGEDEWRSAMDTALRYLAQARTTWEIREKLKKKDYNDELIQEILDKLDDWGYLDDLSYAAALIKDRTAGGKSRREIGEVLYRKGVPREIADAAWEQVSPDTERDAARLYAEKRLKDPGDRVAVAKLKNTMYRKGFPGEMIDDALSGLDAKEEDGDA
ncbi:MAG: RecX family transcriptional regulator [Christensenellales bacterium]|jgi:regulatory protein